MVLFYLPLILIVLCSSLYYFFTRTFNYWKKRNIVGPEPLPFFGNLKDLILRRKNIGVVFQDIYDMYPNEKVVGIFATTTPRLLVRDLDIVKQIMIKDFDMFMDRGIEFSKKGLGANLFQADGDTWRLLRSHLTPIFTSGKLKNMFYLIDERANSFVDYVQKEILISKEHEILNLMQKFTISSISACAFGVELDTLHDKLDALKELDRLILSPTYMAEVDMLFPGIFKKLNLSVFPAKVNNFFYGLVENIVRQRNGKPTNRNDFMDLILELRQTGEISSTKFGTNTKVQISEDLIAAQAFVFYVAGYETSANTMSHLLHQLAVNQDVQDKLITEIDESIAENNGVTYESLNGMKYLEKVFNETLRMHSIVEPLQRMAKTDYHIPGTDITIPNGTMVFISPRGIHYDEKYYPNPEVFDPERFSPEVAKNRHACAYLPFGAGPRNCIGMRFGQVQSKLCIAKFLSKFRVELPSNTKRVLDIEPNRVLMGPKNGIRLYIVPRN